jgi:hypothetical protein
MARFTPTFWAAALLAATLAAAPPPPPPQPGGPAPGPQPGSPYSPVLAPSVSATAVPTTDPAMLAAAKSIFAQIQSGKIDRSQFSTTANGNLTDAQIASAQALVGSLGPPTSFVQQQAGSQGNVNYAIYSIGFANGKKVDFLFARDTQGKIEGLRLGTPH